MFTSAPEHVQLFYPRDQRCDFVEWNNAPKETLHGSRFGPDKIIDSKTIDFAFTVMRVKGRVKWKHLGAVGSRSTLKLNWFDEESGKDVKTLQLGEFVGISDDFATLQFDFEYSTTNSLWGPGEKGCSLALFWRARTEFSFFRLGILSNMSLVC